MGAGTRRSSPSAARKPSPTEDPPTTDERAREQPAPPYRAWRAADEPDEAAANAESIQERKKRRSIWERLGQLIQLSPRGPQGQ